MYPVGNVILKKGGARLTGFTLTDGATRTNMNPAAETYGGGAYCDSRSEVISNCWLLGNVAFGVASGVRNGSLIHCVLSGNLAVLEGGGAGGSVLTDCIITNNRSFNGGGVVGGSLTNCLLAGNVASKWGGGAMSSLLDHCLLTNNWSTSGGGANMSTLISCFLSGNVVAETNFYGGGGAWACNLHNCLLTGNSARIGGGAGNASLYNCTVVKNSASDNGGGVCQASLYNCIVYYNTAPTNSNVGQSGGNYSCLTPLPPDFPGFNNLSNAPLFVDLTDGNFRLQPASPCINAGSNGYVFTNIDLAGNPRIAGRTVDMGAYEFQSPTTVTFYASLVPPINNISGITITWQSVNGMNYFIQRSKEICPYSRRFQPFKATSSDCRARPVIQIRMPSVMGRSSIASGFSRSRARLNTDHAKWREQSAISRSRRQPLPLAPKNGSVLTISFQNSALTLRRLPLNCAIGFTKQFTVEG